MDYTLSYDGSTLLDVDENVEHLVLPDTVTKILYDAIDDSVLNIVSVVAPGVIDIDVNTFFNCKKLEYVDIPKVKIIKNGTFNNCIRLKYINTNCKIIESRAFVSCESLKKIISQNLTKIGNDVFVDCVNLVAIEAPLLSIIGDYSLYNCVSLLYVDCSSSVKLNKAFNDTIQYNNYIQRNRVYKLSKLI